MGDLGISRPTGLAPLPEAYQRLFDDAVAALFADARIRALWVHGSAGRGEADSSSDLDLLLAVTDDDFEQLWAEWPALLARITPTVLARAIPWAPGIVYSLTPDCCRLDLVVERVSAVAQSGFTGRALVFDRDGLDAQVPPSSPAPGPDRAKVEMAIEEPLRFLAMLPALLRRDALLLLQDGYAHMRLRLVELLRQANAPTPTTGVKSRRYHLTGDQYAVLEALPWPAATRDELIDAFLAIGSRLIDLGKPIAAQVGHPWPQPLEDAVRAHLRDELGATLA